MHPQQCERILPYGPSEWWENTPEEGASRAPSDPSLLILKAEREFSSAINDSCNDTESIYLTQLLLERYGIFTNLDALSIPPVSRGYVHYAKMGALRLHPSK